jgi:hypothetical protein
MKSQQFYRDFLCERNVFQIYFFLLSSLFYDRQHDGITRYIVYTLHSTQYTLHSTQYTCSVSFFKVSSCDALQRAYIQQHSVPYAVSVLSPIPHWKAWEFSCSHSCIVEHWSPLCSSVMLTGTMLRTFPSTLFTLTSHWTARAWRIRDHFLSKRR